MKNYLIPIILLVSFLTGCGSVEKKSEQASEQLKNEIVSLDSVSLELEKTKEEILNASEDLDAALEELGN